MSAVLVVDREVDWKNHKSRLRPHRGAAVAIYAWNVVVRAMEDKPGEGFAVVSESCRPFLKAHNRLSLWLGRRDWGCELLISAARIISTKDERDGFVTCRFEFKGATVLSKRESAGARRRRSGWRGVMR